VTVQNIRLSFATYGVAFISTNGHALRHSQFVQCATPVYVSSTTASLQNLLFHKIGSRALYGSGTVTGEHWTVNEASSVVQTTTLNLTNSLLVSITNWPTAFNGAFNVTNSGSGVFQNRGGGYHYLVAASPYRNIGTMNITATLAADLRQRTTYAPIELTSHFAGNTTLGPQAQRDTDTPDLGFHYDPLDYIWSGLNLTNSTLLLTNGVAVGVGGNKGTTLQGGAKFVQTSVKGLFGPGEKRRFRSRE